MQLGQSAFAFTIIEIPDAGTAPGSSITDSTAFNSQLEPITGAIQNHLRDMRKRSRGDGRTAGHGQVLASNSHSETLSDVGFIRVSSHGGGDDVLKNVWFSSSYTDFESDFSLTKHDGTLHSMILGFDLTVSDKYVFGLAVSHEQSDIGTEFNTGKQQIRGFGINTYFAYLISDAWSLDLSLGFGQLDTDQYRGVIALPTVDQVTSDFSTDRSFIASNLTYSVPRGNWYLTGWFGLLLANKDMESFTESDATEIDGEDLDLKRWSLGGEAAYGDADSETYVSLIYEKDEDFNEIEFQVGEQPPNDDDSMLLAVGWRHYGSDLTVNVELNTRLESDDARESSLVTTLRIDL